MMEFDTNSSKQQEALAGLIVGEYLRDHGIKPNVALDKYNEQGIEDGDAIMYLMISSFYYKSPMRKRLR